MLEQLLQLLLKASTERLEALLLAKQLDHLGAPLTLTLTTLTLSMTLTLTPTLTLTLTLTLTRILTLTRPTLDGIRSSSPRGAAARSQCARLAVRCPWSHTPLTPHWTPARLLRAREQGPPRLGAEALLLDDPPAQP